MSESGWSRAGLGPVWEPSWVWGEAPPTGPLEFGVRIGNTNESYFILDVYSYVEDVVSHWLYGHTLCGQCCGKSHAGPGGEPAGVPLRLPREPPTQPCSLPEGERRKTTGTVLSGGEKRASV